MSGLWSTGSKARLGVFRYVKGRVSWGQAGVLRGLGSDRSGLREGMARGALRCFLLGVDIVLDLLDHLLLGNFHVGGMEVCCVTLASRTPTTDYWYMW